MINLKRLYEQKGFVNKINLFEIKNSKFIIHKSNDTTIFWVQSLSSDLEFVEFDDSYFLQYSKKYNFYILSLTSYGEIPQNFEDIVRRLNEKENYLHFIFSDGKFSSYPKCLIEMQKLYKNIKYSLLNINSEIFYVDEPYDLKNLSNISFIFTGSNIVDRSRNYEWLNENQNKIIIDFKYPLIHFYFKFGFNYYISGENKLDIINRENKVFFYSKTAGEHTERYFLSQMALKTKRIYEKAYSEKDWFWYQVNYNYYHMPYFYDYNLCKFNLINETLSPTLNDWMLHNQFCGEKTLKALMVSTPSYVLLQSVVYEELKNYGFYFLNSEFGQYTDIGTPFTLLLCENEKPGSPFKEWYENYNKFLHFIEHSSEDEFDDMFNKAFQKSKKNKLLLEKYIFSDKEKEIDLLLQF